MTLPLVRLWRLLHSGVSFTVDSLLAVTRRNAISNEPLDFKGAFEERTAMIYDRICSPLRAGCRGTGGIWRRRAGTPSWSGAAGIMFDHR
jgi:hypothetical protein